MKKLLFIFLISIPFLTKAQNCNCSDNFKFVVQRIKNNYPGYKDKVTPAKQQRFDFFTDSLQKVAASADRMSCIEVCNEWLAFFKDKHMSISSFAPGKATEEEIRNFFAGSEKTTWNEQNFKVHLEHNKNTLDEIEGIWFSDSGGYKIGIVRDSTQGDGEFVGFVIKAGNLNWAPGQVKLRIRKTGNTYQILYFRLIDHSKFHPSFVKTGDKFNLGYYGDWFKNELPKNNNVNTLKGVDYNPSFKVLDKETNLITLPSFKLHYKKAIDSLIENNKSVLDHSKHLIIDIRDNSGGSYYPFEKLIPYIYTNPILIGGGAVLATAENIKDGYDHEIKDVSEEAQKLFKEELKKLKEHEGELYPLYPDSTLTLPGILKNPQRVSVIMNGASASAAEILILRAEQSKKVTLFGQNSAGAIDYVETVTTKMPCSYFDLNYPACRIFSVDTRPLDNIGIPPNVLIPDSIPDWVEFVRKYKKP